MDVQRREKIRMLVRILDSIAEEVRRVSSEEEDMLSSGSAPSKENRGGPNFRRSAALSSHSSHRSLRCPPSHESRCRR
jgi:hypothetical protein